MKKFHLFLFALSGLIVLTMQSCVDKDYDFDNLDKEGYVSPNGIVLPLGDIIPPALLQDLPPIPFPISGYTEFQYDVEGVFTDEINENFFYRDDKNPENTVALAGLADVIINNNTGGYYNITIYPEILDKNGNTLAIDLAPIELTGNKTDNPFSIKFVNSDMEIMQDASGIRFIIAVELQNYLPSSGDGIVFKKLKIEKTGGIIMNL